LLYHAEQANDQTAIARYALQAGAQALASFNYPAAQKYFAQALHTLAPDELAARFDAAEGWARTLEVLAQRDAQRRATMLLQTLADALGDDRRRAEAARQRAELEWMTGQFAEAKTIAESGLRLARRLNDARQQALLLELVGRCARDLGEYAQALEWFRLARTCCEQTEDERGAAWIDGMLGLVAQRQGRVQEAIEYQTRAMNAHRDIGNPFNEMRAANGLAIALWMSGDYLQARAIFERTLHLSREVNDRRVEEACLANLGGLADILGDYNAAVELKEQALALSRASDNKMGIALGLSNLGITYYKLGQMERSLASFDEAIEIDRAIGRRQGEGYSWHGRGMTLLEMGRLREAYEALAQAQAIRSELGERDLLAATEADLALVALAEEEPERARAHMQAALDLMQADERPDLRQQIHYTAYRVRLAHDDVEAAMHHLQRAEAAMLELAQALPREASERFLQHDPFSRRVRAALDSLAHKTRVRLVRAHVPLGRKLIDDDYVLVEWTLHTAADDALDHPTERRRAVLQRLLTEAEAQGAAPTDSDLAHALGVSRRTILRDMDALAQSGVTLPTRRRRDA
jgi:tetratricopeptide (TPR) repeat protein